MTLHIVTVESKRDFKRFIELPWQIYDAVTYPLWVPPLRLMVMDALDDRKNVFYERAARALFLAVRGDKVVGRIAAIENRAHNAFHQDKVGFFGFFEAFDDQDAANALFEAAAAWLRARGLDTMRGPMSPSTNHETGLLVGGFDVPPTIMTPWNPPYVAALVENAGFAKAKDLLAYYFPGKDPNYLLPERFEQHAARARSRTNLTFRDVDLSQFSRELDICWQIYNAAWDSNWGFVPMTKKEFVHMAQEMKYLIYPQFAFIAEVDGVPAGFMLLLPDFNEIFRKIPNGKLLPTGVFKLLLGRKKLKSFRVILMGVAAEFRTRSIFQLFTHEVWCRGRAFDATGAEASWILEDNVLMTRSMESAGVKEYRRWRVYDRPLAG
ncbi:MAG: N-acetyltransferase [Phycisphaerae bacterium]|nr:N-acetyltransferase [Gemmatimonadaceae bacterium]